MPKPATFIVLPMPINPRKWYIVLGDASPKSGNIVDVLSTSV